MSQLLSEIRHIQKNRPDIDNVYIAFRGVGFLTFLEELGGYLIWKNKRHSSIGDLYLIKIEWAQFLSNPIIFNILKKQLVNYELLSMLGEIDFNFSR